MALLALDVVEELLYGVQPRGVLSVEQHVRLELPGCLVDGRHLVDGGVVHQDDDVLALRAGVDSQLVQHTV